MRFQPTSMSRDDIECTPIVKRDDNENTCGTSASCDIDIRLHCVFAHCSHHCADALLCCR
jgi:hypothetical protein